MTTLPISGTVEFRPNSAAVKAAREALEKIKNDVRERTPEGVFPSPEDNKSMEDAQKALDKAEEARAKADPVFSLIVPTGKTLALTQYDMEMDPDVPALSSLKDGIADVIAEAEAAGKDDDSMSALKRAKELADSGKPVEGDDWAALAKAATGLYAWRKLMAPWKLYGALEAGYRVRRHLVLSKARTVLTDADLERKDIKPYVQAIAAELTRLSNLSEDDAKNSDAP